MYLFQIMGTEMIEDMNNIMDLYWGKGWIMLSYTQRDRRGNPSPVSLFSYGYTANDTGTALATASSSRAK